MNISTQILFRFIAIVLLLFLAIDVISQNEVVRVPIQFSQYRQTISLINPGYICNQNQFELNVGTQRNSGLWKHVHTEFIQINKELFSGKFKKNRLKQSGGLFFVSDNEGQFLKRSYGYASYSVTQHISKEAYLSTGAYLGLASFIVKSSSNSVGGGDNTLDGGVGFWLSQKKMSTGLSINQLFNSLLIPLDEASILKRHYNYILIYDYDASYSIVFSPSVIVRWIDFQNYYWNVNVRTVFNDIVLADIGYGGDKNMDVSFGLSWEHRSVGFIKVFFSYEFQIGSSGANLNRYEFTFGSFR